MTNTGLWPWPDPTNHEIQMLRTKCMELEGAIKAQSEQLGQVRKLRATLNALIAVEGWGQVTPEKLVKSIVNKLNDALGDTDD